MVLSDVRPKVKVKPAVVRMPAVLKSVKLNASIPNTALLRCYVINTRSLRKNNAVQLLPTELNSIDGDVADVTETWLSKKVSSDHISIPGYNLLRQG